MELLNLLAVASMPVLKVLIVTALGLFLALENIDILGAQARHHFNQVVFYVLNPALIGVNLAQTVTYESFISLWFLPFNILITFIVGSALGWILIRITNPPKHLRGLILGCCAAGNLGNMPLIIIPAICKEKGSPLGAPDSCQAYGLAYASLSLAIGAILLWSYVYNIMRISNQQDDRIQDVESVSKLKQQSDYSSQDLTHPLLLPNCQGPAKSTSLFQKIK